MIGRAINKKGLSVCVNENVFLGGRGDKLDLTHNHRKRQKTQKLQSLI